MATYPDQYTKILLHYNGPDGSQQIIETGGKVFTANANAQLDTAQSKFGGASLLLDGFDDYISAPDHADFDIGMSEFAIDFQIRFNALPAAYQVDHICGHGNAGQNRWHLYIYNNNLKYDLYFVAYEGDTPVLTIVATNLTIALASWYHFAITAQAEGSGRRFRIFQNGEPKIGSGGTFSTQTIPDAVGDFRIGTQFGDQNFVNGWIDEFRFSVGTYRWADTFTPPAEEYHYKADFSNAPMSMIVTMDIDVNPIEAAFSFTSFDLNEYAQDFSPAPLLLAGSLISDSPFIPNYGQIDFPLFRVSGNARTTRMAGQINFPLFQVSGVALAGNLGRGSIKFSTFIVTGRFGLRGEIDFPLFRVSGQGKTGHAIRGEIVFPVFDVSGQGTTNRLSSGLIEFPVFVVQGQATQHFGGQGAIDFKPFRVLGFGYTGLIGTGEIVFPAPVIAGRAFFLARGQGSIVFPAFVVSGYARASVRDRLTIAMNVQNKAVTEYLDYGFNSFASIHGVFYGARDDGIWKLEGEKDNGIEIDSEILSGVFDFWIGGKTKPRKAWLTFRGDGRMILKVVIDEKEVWEDEFPAFLDRIGEAGTTIAKGIKERFLAFGIKNKNGTDFEVDSLRILVDKLGRVR